MIGYQSELVEQDQLKSIQPKLNKMFVLPLVKIADKISIPAEVMIGIWQQIVNEKKSDYLFYDSAVNDLKGWLDYIYNPSNYVALVIDESGHIYHIAWINKYYQGHGFVHHCSLGPYNRKTWPILRDYWAGMRRDDNTPVIHTVMGVTPETNEKAVKLLSVIGWTKLGVIPGLCFIAKENRHVGGIISYYVLNEV